MAIRASGGRGARAGLLAGLVAALAVAAAGCSGDGGDGGEGEREPVGGAPSEVAEPEAVDEGAPVGDEDVGELTDLFRAYWDVLVEMENGGELDPSLFDGIAAPGVVESDLGRIGTFRDNGLHREGEPAIDGVTVTLDGDTARIEACKNETGWNMVHEGEVVPDVIPRELLEPHATVATADASSGAWLITGYLSGEDATITCP